MSDVTSAEKRLKKFGEAHFIISKFKVIIQSLANKSITPEFRVASDKKCINPLAARPAISTDNVIPLDKLFFSIYNVSEN